jgi:hypothetical protein
MLWAIYLHAKNAYGRLDGPPEPVCTRYGEKKYLFLLPRIED